jgi:hypothetical protein
MTKNDVIANHSGSSSPHPLIPPQPPPTKESMLHVGRKQKLDKLALWIVVNYIFKNLENKKGNQIPG